MRFWEGACGLEESVSDRIERRRTAGDRTEGALVERALSAGDASTDRVVSGGRAGQQFDRGSFVCQPFLRERVAQAVLQGKAQGVGGASAQRATGSLFPPASWRRSKRWRVNCPRNWSFPFLDSASTRFEST